MNKILLLITGILVIAVLLLVAYDNRSEATITYGQPSESVVTPPNDSPTTTASNIPYPVLSAIVDKTGQQKKSTQKTEREQTSPPDTCEHAAFIVGEKSYTPCVTAEITVFSLMQELTKEGLAFSGKEYPSLGFFVESINSQKAENGYYWFLYINDVSSTEGPSTARVKAGDRVEWRYKVGY